MYFIFVRFLFDDRLAIFVTFFKDFDHTTERSWMHSFFYYILKLTPKNFGLWSLGAEMDHGNDQSRSSSTSVWFSESLAWGSCWIKGGEVDVHLTTLLASTLHPEHLSLLTEPCAWNEVLTSKVGFLRLISEEYWSQDGQWGWNFDSFGLNFAKLVLFLSYITTWIH